jgi:hypothetical protein
MEHLAPQVQESLDGTGRSLAALKRASGGLSVATMLRTGLGRVSTAHHTGTASQSGNWLLGGAQLGMRRAALANSAPVPAANPFALSKTVKTALFKPSIPPKQARSEASKATVIYLFTGSNTPYESHV